MQAACVFVGESLISGLNSPERKWYSEVIFILLRAAFYVESTILHQRVHVDLHGEFKQKKHNTPVTRIHGCRCNRVLSNSGVAIFYSKQQVNEWTGVDGEMSSAWVVEWMETEGNLTQPG